MFSKAAIKRCNTNCTFNVYFFLKAYYIGGPTRVKVRTPILYPCILQNLIKFLALDNGLTNLENHVLKLTLRLTTQTKLSAK